MKKNIENLFSKKKFFQFGVSSWTASVPSLLFEKVINKHSTLILFLFTLKQF